jgi:DNA polymerase V
MLIQNNNNTNVQDFVSTNSCLLVLYCSKVQAGFPSPADDYIDKPIDLIAMLIKKPAATYLVKAQGDSMEGEGIYDGDILIVDRSLKATSGRIVIAAIEGQLTVKKLVLTQSKCKLVPANPKYPSIEIPEGTELHIWGIVTNVIHHLLR